MTYRQADAHADIEALFQQIQERSYNRELFQVSFSGVKSEVSVRPGVSRSRSPSSMGEVAVIAVLDSKFYGEGVYLSDTYPIRMYLRTNPGADQDIAALLQEKLKKAVPQIKKRITDHYEDPNFTPHLLTAVFGFRESSEWDNVSGVRVSNIEIGKPDFKLQAPWTATVTFTATKKAAATAVFSAMSDRELDKWIGKFESDAPENFWMDGELRMSRPAAYKMYRQRWRQMSPREQQSMMESLKRDYGRYASVNRVAAAFMTANPEMDPDQAINQLPTRLAETGAVAGSDGNYMTKQNLFLLHRMSEMLYEGIPHGKLLPDWAESKINSAADHLKSVAGWAMHESHGDDLHHGPEANPIHLARRRG